MSTMVERVCRHNRISFDTADAIARALERTGSVAEAVFCLRAMGLTQQDIGYALEIPQTRVWVILHRDLVAIQSLLEAGVVA